MKTILFIVSFLYLSAQLIAQDCTEKIQDAEFEYFSIPEKLNKKDWDSIRFLISTPYYGENPTLIFIASEGYKPLLSYTANEEIHIELPFDMAAYKDAYNFILISKPGIPICIEASDEEAVFQAANENEQTKIFEKLNTNEYYVSQIQQLIEHLRAKVLKKSTPIYLMGEGEGGVIAAKYCLQNPKSIEKLILYNTSLFPPEANQVLLMRQNQLKENASLKEIQEKINQLYTDYRNKVVKSPKPTEFAIDYLLQLDLPILCVYHTNLDENLCNDLLPFFFLKQKKYNFQLIPLAKTNVKGKGDIQVKATLFDPIEKWILIEADE